MINSAKTLTRETGSSAGKATGNMNEYRRNNYTSNQIRYSDTWNDSEPIKAQIARDNGLWFWENPNWKAGVHDWMSGATVSEANKNSIKRLFNQDTREFGKTGNPIVDFMTQDLTEPAMNLVNNVTSGNGIGNTGSRSVAGSSSGSSVASSVSDGTGYNIDDIFKLVEKYRNEDRVWNAEQAQKQMDFQERMARNAHTYEMEDLKRAGLNPVLAAGANSGAASPNGSSATSSTDLNTIANLAMMALQTVQVTSAAGAVNKSKGKSGIIGWLSDKDNQNAVKTAASIASLVGTLAAL